MMSLRALGNLGSGGAGAKAAAHYYREQSAEYYIGSNEPNGLWIGGGAPRFGLQTGPTREQLQLALAGQVAGRRVLNSGKPNRQTGWDLTFSAPKSVSIAWAFARPDHGREILTAHEAAARAAHKYIESQVKTRRGGGGLRSEPARLVSTMFTHFTSRAGDPQLHSHVVVPNFCGRDDGTVGTIDSRPFYDLRRTAGNLYQAELSHRMKQLGYAIGPGPGGTFRLTGVDPRIEVQFSKRAQEIDRVAREQGIRTYVGTRAIVLKTRPRKKHALLEERLSAWRTESKTNQLDFEIERGRGQSSGGFSSEQVLREAAGKITEQNSTFKDRELVRELARASYGELNAEQIQTLAKNSLALGIVHRIGRDKNGQEIYTTREMLAVERAMVDAARALVAPAGFSIRAPIVLTPDKILSAEQQAALHAAGGDGALAVIQGRAGTGKTTTLSAIRTSYQQAGWRVQGLAISGQAAQNLQNESRIESRTLASWLMKEPDPKTILVVDEAGLIGSKKMRDLFERARQSHSKVILVGDERQLQPLEAGGALRAVDRELVRAAPHSSSQMETIHRQKEEWMRDAVQAAAKGNTSQALEALEAHKKIALYGSADAASMDLIEDYLGKNVSAQDQAVILTHRKGDASRINDAIRRQLQQKGLVGDNQAQVHNGQRAINLAVGDRVMILRNDYRLAVRNGQRGTVQEIQDSAREIGVRLDGAEMKMIPLDSYTAIDYGWASTTHKAQGLTVERAYVYGHIQESMASQQATYVQISRAKGETRLYLVHGEAETSLQNEERKTVLEQLKKHWGRDAAKDTTLDYGREGQPAHLLAMARE